MFANVRDWTIEWGDCDPAGIVFFPRFFAAFDTSTARLIEAATGQRTSDIYRANGIIGWPMVNTTTRFMQPATFGDTVRIESRVTRIGTASLAFEHSLLLETKLCVETSEVRVWAKARPDGQKGIVSAPIPRAIVNALSVT